MDIGYESLVRSYLTLLDRIEMVVSGGEPRKVLPDDLGRTLAERLRDNAHGDELELMGLSDDAEEAAAALDDVRKWCGERFQIAEEHGLRVEFGGPSSGVEH